MAAQVPSAPGAKLPSLQLSVFLLPHPTVLSWVKGPGGEGGESVFFFREEKERLTGISDMLSEYRTLKKRHNPQRAQIASSYSGLSEYKRCEKPHFSKQIRNSKRLSLPQAFLRPHTTLLLSKYLLYILHGLLSGTGLGKWSGDCLLCLVLLQTLLLRG